MNGLVGGYAEGLRSMFEGLRGTRGGVPRGC